MATKNRSVKIIWNVSSSRIQFVIIANNEKECKELIDEYAEEEVTEKFTYEEIGFIRPTSPYFKHWEGDSKIILTNM